MNLMFYIGPAIGVIVTVATLFFVFRMLGGLAKAKREEARILSTGTPAQGQIMAVQQTGTYINNNPQVVIVVQVTPQGGAPYQTQITKVVSMFEIPQYQVGAQVALRIDPVNPMNVAIAGGMPPGAMGGMPPGMPQGMPPQGMPPQQMQQPGYPPQQQGYAPQQPGYPPQQAGYPPQGAPPQQPGYPPQQGGWPGGRPPNG